VETYEEQVVRYLRAMFDDGDHPYVKDVQLEGKMITVTFYDKHIGKDRVETFDVYDDYNDSGYDYPGAVASRIGTRIDEHALAHRKA
jgi:hypothetical protein